MGDIWGILGPSLEDLQGRRVLYQFYIVSL